MSSHAPPESDEELATRFELLELLGRGSYGSVYKGAARDTGEHFAIKVITHVEGVRHATQAACLPEHFASVLLAHPLVLTWLPGRGYRRDTARD